MVEATSITGAVYAQYVRAFVLVVLVVAVIFVLRVVLPRTFRRRRR